MTARPSGYFTTITPAVRQQHPEAARGYLDRFAALEPFRPWAESAQSTDVVRDLLFDVLDFTRTHASLFDALCAAFALGGPVSAYEFILARRDDPPEPKPW